MLIALNSQSERTHGADAIRQEKYHCQQCGQQVMAKKGNIMIHHFAHYPGSPSCVWWEPETPLHLLMKQESIALLKRDNNTVLAELEYKLNLNGNILFPDVYLELRDGKKIAIECQVSKKPLSDFIEKTEQYSGSNIYTLWIFPLGDYSNDYNIVSAMQRQSHTWNFGRIYTLGFNLATSTITALHFRGVYKRDEPVWRPPNGYGFSKVEHEGWEEDIMKVDHRPRTPKESSSITLKNASLLCMENDGIKIARFYDKKWWK
jgi:competence CoiA-like predicted nuclease